MKKKKGGADILNNMSVDVAPRHKGRHGAGASLVRRTAFKTSRASELLKNTYFFHFTPSPTSDVLETAAAAATSLI